MRSIAIGVQLRSAVERHIPIEAIGEQFVRRGLIVVLAWIGAMKFTAY